MTNSNIAAQGGGCCGIDLKGIYIPDRNAIVFPCALEGNKAVFDIPNDFFYRAVKRISMSATARIPVCCCFSRLNGGNYIFSNDFYIISTGGRSPYRLRIRSPSFNNIATLPQLVEGGLIADVIANIASLDPVMGEVDR